MSAEYPLVGGAFGPRGASARARGESNFAASVVELPRAAESPVRHGRIPKLVPGPSMGDGRPECGNRRRTAGSRRYPSWASHRNSRHGPRGLPARYVAEAACVAPLPRRRAGARALARVATTRVPDSCRSHRARPRRGTSRLRSGSFARRVGGRCRCAGEPGCQCSRQRRVSQARRTSRRRKGDPRSGSTGQGEATQVGRSAGQLSQRRSPTYRRMELMGSCSLLCIVALALLAGVCGASARA